MRGIRHIVGAVLVSMVLAGCAGQSEDGSESENPATSDPGAPGSADPVTLIGSWLIEEAAQEESGAVLRIAANDISLWRECGTLSGAWRADTGGLFVADIYGGTGCEVTDEPTPGWLQEAVGFRAAGDDRLLVDAQGDTVARLLPGGKPEAGPDTAPEQAEPPVVDDEVRRAFAPTADLPAGLNPPPAREALVGRWEPESGPGSSPEPVYVELLADGGWRGSDGCNGQGGRWVTGAGGAFLATSGASTLVACENAPIGQWLSGAWQVGMDGPVLVLVDAQGNELGRVKPVQ